MNTLIELTNYLSRTEVLINGRKKDIYKCNKLKGDDALVIWYNEVIEKSPDELNISDVTRCIRQNLFTETAYEMLLVYLLNNPYAGDVYGGELMDKAADIDREYLLQHKKTVSEIIKNAGNFIETYEWEVEEDKSEYGESVERLVQKIS